jgi:hypothetical protein
MTPLNDGRARDGAGFDLDLGTENGMIQYNWSHDNEGEGYLLLTWPIGFGYDRGVSRNVQMRYNISERDGKKLGGGITIFGGVSPVVIYNNLVYYESARSIGTEMFNGEGGALTSSIWGKSGQPDARIFNNIFIVNGRTNPAAASNNLWTDGAGTFTFNNNVWWRVEGGVRFQWGGSVASSWANWQALGFDAQSFNVDPLIAGAPGAGPNAYQLRTGSPAIDRARVVTDALRGMGSRDYLGVPTAQGAAYDIGAFEYKVVPEPARFLQMVRQLDGGWRLELTGTAGRNYAIERSSNLFSWTRLGQARENSPGAYDYMDRNAESAAFYRALGQ